MTATEPATGTDKGRGEATTVGPAPRVLLLVPARTYRAADFILAANRMDLELVIGSDGALPLGGHPVIQVSTKDLQGSADRLMTRSGPVSAVVAADTPMLALAATVAARMGLPGSPVQAVTAASDKTAQRLCWAAASLAQPAFRIVPGDAPDDSVRQAAAEVGLPCVIKAVSLSASQGILRADSTAAAVAAARRVRRILAASRRPRGEPLLVEEYVPGPELSIDGLLTAGDLTVTAVFDKPCTPEGPTFEETVLTTPSRLPEPVLAAAIATAGQAARTLGLTHGPIHAELRIDDRGSQAEPALLELAARSIGGLCSRVLRFPGDTSLEEMVLANALGRPTPHHHLTQPLGVLMLPIPRPGLLRTVDGCRAATAIPGITGLTITIPAGQRVQPLPEGDRYLGFIFAEGDTHKDVENALEAARDQLHIVIQ
ncbi:MAG TPA: ATP-grasp domain-containing protein [Streptosporangiaceae bacterium]